MIRSSIESWLLSKMFSEGKLDLSNTLYKDIERELYFKELAIAKVISLIGGAFNSCPLNFYKNSEETNNISMYALWNIKPNKNENINEFRSKIISHLIKDNECLVIYYNDQLFVADDFYREEYALMKNTYKSVVVKDYNFKKTFYEDEVFYFSLNDENIKRYIDGVYESYAQLLGASKEIFLDQSDKHYFLNISSTARGDLKFNENYKDMTTGKLKKFLKHGKSVMPVYEGFKWEKQESKVNASTADYREMKKEVFSTCAQAYNIPAAMMFMDTADINDNIIDNFITFAVKSYLNMIAAEISKYFSDTSWQCKFDLTNIKYFNPLEKADKIEKIIGCAVWCIDEVRVKLGEKPLNTDWSKRHYMTKNLGTIEEVLKLAEDYETISIHDEDSSKGGDDK